MSLTALFRIVLLVLLGFFSLLLLVILEVQHLQRETIQAEEKRYRSYRFAEELRQSSDDLTRMARSYVSSGDRKYLEYYHHILDIRNGKKPRPTNYPTTFWYLFPAQKVEFKEDKTIPLVKLMKEYGFSDKELALLGTSQKRSDHLVKMEHQAFAAMDGRFEDAEGDFDKKGPPDPTLARKLLFSQEYDSNKVRIMEPIDQFLFEVDARTRLELKRLEQQVLQHIRYAVALLGGFIVVVPFMGILVRRQIMVPLSVLVQRAKEIAAGNYSSRIPVRGIQEFTVLNEGFNEMSKAIDREVTELKKLQEALKKSEVNLTKAQEIAKTGSWYVDSMEIIHLSDEAMRILEIDDESGLDFEKLLSIVHPEDRNHWQSAWESARSGRPLDVEHRITTGDKTKWIHMKGELTGNQMNGLESGLGTIQDISNRKQSDLREEKRRYILELIANGTSVHIVLDTLVTDLEEELPESLGCIMMATSSGRHLKLSSAPSLPTELAEALDGIEIEPGSAGCGTAAFTGESVVVEDIRSHPNFHRLRESLRKTDVRCCWSFPIMSGSNDVLGTLDLYHRKSCYPTGSEQRAINSFVHLAGIALSSSVVSTK